jgi:arginase
MKHKKKYNYKTIILFPHNLGQTKTGSEKAPKYLNKFINRKKHIVKMVKNAGNLFKNLSELYKKNKESQGKIINIGGDHSMAISTIADTLNKYPDAKVIYFDAHADINTYKSSNSKHYHGMPLSFVTGIDEDKHFSFIKNLLPFENLLYIGSRCWDTFEVNEVYKDKIKFLTPDDINKNFADSLHKILNFVGDSPVHVSFDVDSIDPKYIPSTGTPVKNGVEMKNAMTILDKLNNTNIVKMDITELNMDLGTKEDGIKSGINTEKLFHKFIN